MMTAKKPIHAVLTMLTPWGKYILSDKEFVDDNHLTNYSLMMVKKGYKIVSTEVFNVD
jgi:hypothetical protein